MSGSQLTLEDGTVISGGSTFIEDGMTGFGRIEASDGSVYVGSLRICRRYGTGVFQHTNGCTFVGEFDNGARNGHGTLYFSKRDSGEDGARCLYTGSWFRDRRTGAGLAVYPQGVYHGSWANDLRHGLGHMVWLDSLEEYVGAWKDGLQDGEGVHSWHHNAPTTPKQGLPGLQLHLSNGSVATKVFDSIRDECEPKLEVPSTDSKEEHHVTPELLQDYQHPNPDSILAALQSHLSTLTLRARYRGQFSKGRKSGFGVFEYPDGGSYAGFWDNDVKHGPGVLTATDGTVFFARFEHDKPVASATMDRFLHAAYSESFQQFSGTALLSLPGVNVSQKLISQLRIQDLLASTDVSMATRELINVVLRWNTQLKAWYDKYAAESSDYMESFRKRVYDSPTTLLTDVLADRAFRNELPSSSTRQPMQQYQLWRFLHDCGLLLGGVLSLADVNEMLVGIRAREISAAIRAGVGAADSSAESKEENEEKVNNTYSPATIPHHFLRKYVRSLQHVHDPFEPVCFREFVEVLVRVAHRRLLALGGVAMLEGDASAAGEGDAFAAKDNLVRATSAHSDRHSVHSAQSRFVPNINTSGPSSRVSVATGNTYNSESVLQQPPKQAPTPDSPAELAQALHCTLWYRVYNTMNHQAAASGDILRKWVYSRGFQEHDSVSLALEWAYIAVSAAPQTHSSRRIIDILNAPVAANVRASAAAIVSALGLHDSSVINELLESAETVALEWQVTNPDASEASVAVQDAAVPMYCTTVGKLLKRLRRAGVVETTVKLSDVELPAATQSAPSTPGTAGTGDKSLSKHKSSASMSSARGAANVRRESSVRTLTTASSKLQMTDSEDKPHMEAAKTFAANSAVLQKFRAHCEAELQAAPVLDDVVAATVVLRGVATATYNTGSPTSAAVSRGSALESKDVIPSPEASPEVAPSTVNPLAHPTCVIHLKPDFSIELPAPPVISRPITPKSVQSKHSDGFGLAHSAPNTAVPSVKEVTEPTSPTAVTTITQQAVRNIPPQAERLITIDHVLPTLTLDEALDKSLTLPECADATLRLSIARADIMQKRRVWLQSAREVLQAAVEPVKAAAFHEAEAWHREIEAAAETTAALSEQQAEASAAKLVKPGSKAAAVKPASVASKRPKGADGEESGDADLLRIAKADIERALDELSKKVNLVIDHLASLSEVVVATPMPEGTSEDAAEAKKEDDKAADTERVPNMEDFYDADGVIKLLELSNVQELLSNGAAISPRSDKPVSA